MNTTRKRRQLARAGLIATAVLALATPSIAPTAAAAAGGSAVTATGYASGASARSASTSSGDADGFLGIANGASTTVKAIATVLGGILVIGLVAWAIVERSVKSILVAGVLTILAALVISGQFWSSAQSTADQISGASAPGQNK